MKTKVFSILLAAILLVMGAVAQTTTQPAQTPATPAPAQTTAHPGVLSDAEIRNILIERIDTYHQSVGIVVGVIDASGRRVIAYGSLQKGDPRPLDGNTVFEIGSISKVFTRCCWRTWLSAAKLRSMIPRASTCRRPSRCRSAAESKSR